MINSKQTTYTTKPTIMHFLELMLAMIGFHISAIHAAPTELPTVVIARSQTRGLPLCGQYYTTGPRPEQEPFSLVAGHAYHNVEDGFHIAGVMNHWCSLCTVWA